MDRNEQTLSLIGLCLRGRNLEVGEEPVEAVARARDARVLLLASDAADNTARRVRRFAEMGQCVWLRVPFTKRELGLATGRASAAVAAITDIGLAVAVVRRLAEAEPEKYDEDLAKLELKAKRAAERKSEAAQHEKNLRRGGDFFLFNFKASVLSRQSVTAPVGLFSYITSIERASGCFTSSLGSVMASTPSLYFTLMASSLMPETSNDLSYEP